MFFENNENFIELAVTYINTSALKIILNRETLKIITKLKLSGL